MLQRLEIYHPSKRQPTYPSRYPRIKWVMVNAR
jgi:hypothetical protein